MFTARRTSLLALFTAVAFASAAVSAFADGRAPRPDVPTRHVLMISNNWEGTADIVDVPSYERIKRINVVPDLEERMTQILADPARLAVFLFIRKEIGEGHDQLVDDLVASNDGRTIYASRPSLADVVALDVGTGKLVWRTPVDGYRAEHVTGSPDGKRLVVSASTASVGNVLDTETGKIVGRFPSGDQPHENYWSNDGSKIYHASVGRVFTALDEPPVEKLSKGDRVFEIVDSNTMEVLKKINMGEKLAEFGMPDVSAAVRPMALTPDERFMYFQASFFHGFFEYDLQEHKILRVAHLPLSEKARQMRRDQYTLDAAHYGLAIDGEGTKLCSAGTISDYVAIVSRETLKYRILPMGRKPYWASSSDDGRYCYVSVAGQDEVSIIDFDKEEEIARIPAGDHPQRVRDAWLAQSVVGAPAPKARVQAGPLTLEVSPAHDRKAPYRYAVRGVLALPGGVDVAQACAGMVRLELRKGTRVVSRAGAPLHEHQDGCGFERTLTAPARVARRGKVARLVAGARFVGNDALLPQLALKVRLRAGGSR
jgi:YVTN family beta-propeller protein